MPISAERRNLNLAKETAARLEANRRENIEHLQEGIMKSPGSVEQNIEMANAIQDMNGETALPISKFYYDAQVLLAGMSTQENKK